MYINRAETAEFFEKSKQTMWHKDDIAATISSKKNIPYADVAEVVRCRDCKCYEIHKPSVTMNCERDGRLVPMMPDDYCSYGERRSK
jgi:hypothetical protein